jgi:HK97 family phage prohead protease
MPLVSPQQRELFIPARPDIVGAGDERRIRARANTDDLDRYGTVIEPQGMRAVRGPVPLLLSHDRDRAVGKIEFIERSEEAVEFEALITDDAAWKMLKDGVLSGVSVGFIAHHWFDEDGTTFIDDWELIEISLVTIPANEMATILEMRSVLEHEVWATRAAPDPTRTPPSRGAPADPPTRTVASRTIVPNTQPLGEVIAPSGQVYRDIPLRAPMPALHQRGRLPRFSISAVIASRLAGSELSGFEREVCGELQARTYGPVHGDIRVPAAVFQRRDLSTNAGSGAALSPDAFLQSMLDDVAAARRWGTLSPRLGYTIISTEREMVHVPRRLSVLDAEFQAKDAPATESDTTFDEQELTPRYIGITTTIRRSSLRYSDPAADGIITTDIRRALDDRIDGAVLFGTGAGNLPIGLLTAPPAALTIDKAGDPIAAGDLFDLKQRMMTTFKLDDATNGLRWCTNPALIDRLRTTSKKEITAPGGEWFSGIMPFSSDESQLVSIMLIQSGRVIVSGQNQTNLYLVMPELGVIAYFGGAAVDLLIDPYTLSAAGGHVRLSAYLDLNTLARDPNIVGVITNADAAPIATGPAPTPATPRTPPPAARTFPEGAARP